MRYRKLKSEEIKSIALPQWMFEVFNDMETVEEQIQYLWEIFYASQTGEYDKSDKYKAVILKRCSDYIKESREKYIEKATAIGMKGKEFGVQGGEHGIKGKEFGVQGKEYGILGGRKRKDETDEEYNKKKRKKKEISDYIRGDAKIIEEIEGGVISQMTINALNEKFNAPSLVDSVLKYYIKNHIKNYKK